MHVWGWVDVGTWCCLVWKFRSGFRWGWRASAEAWRFKLLGWLLGYLMVETLEVW
ncbi:hypothetical protein [Candidatus Hodgkinia cicadicola]|uniref:hypothetical protein n=1 Tax=Candidatus Hodgkinia cicadicola TaxID=573658 RepID=UPI001788C577